MTVTFTVEVEVSDCSPPIYMTLRRGNPGAAYAVAEYSGVNGKALLRKVADRISEEMASQLFVIEE